MFTTITLKFGDHSSLVLRTMLSQVKGSYQELIAHYVYVVGQHEKKVDIHCEGTWHEEIDKQIDENLAKWIAEFKINYQLE
ncbi:hypothetical protein PP939_gp138 [Rhizobium phage RL38J1]|uniref:Uncharacterized protein n=1 Tax=Rhizobium phage RL38J1 TaxID=2663232 RepID=A0A6B9J305_9CAUD|nr:hypothetical protein PP939_gp138 [Rhizobium phage RL38J1]QGZ14033.1 hypothetical protein RL38J1_138 [Rhizobium phage RL38J1]